MTATTIVQLTDLHLRPRGLPAYRVVETNMLTARALRAVTALRPAPDAVLISGDLTDNGRPDEYAVLSALLDEARGNGTLACPVHLIPGNHDIRENLLAARPETPSADGFVQYAVDDLPVRIVMLDTVVAGAGHGALDGGRLDWLDRTLSARPDTPTLIAMHHPPFLCGIEHMDAIALRDADAFAATLARHRQVERIVCGHHHRDVVARVGPAIATICPSVAHQVELDLRPGAPSAFVMEPAQFQIHRWTPATGFVSHTAHVEQAPGPFPFVVEADYPGGRE